MQQIRLSRNNSPSRETTLLLRPFHLYNELIRRGLLCVHACVRASMRACVHACIFLTINPATNWATPLVQGQLLPMDGIIQTVSCNALIVAWLNTSQRS